MVSLCCLLAAGLPGRGITNADTICSQVNDIIPSRTSVNKQRFILNFCDPSFGTGKLAARQPEGETCCGAVGHPDEAEAGPHRLIRVVASAGGGGWPFSAGGASFPAAGDKPP